MTIDKSDWIHRYELRHRALAPHAPAGLLAQIAETHWFYLRHRAPEHVAEDRAFGRLPARTRAESWIEACTEALRGLDPYMRVSEARALAEQLWGADLLHAVDPYVMANALWEQALLMNRPESDHQGLWSVLRAPRAPS